MKTISNKLQLLALAGMIFLAACGGPDSEQNTTTTTNSGGENGVDITRVPNMDSSVLSNDSAGVTGDTTNLQTHDQK